MREDLSAETLDVVYDGSKMTLGALFSIFQIASEHHNKSIHTGEQSVKHFYESAQKNEILDEIDPEDWRGIRSMMKNRYHLDFAYEKDAEKGTYTLHFRGKDLATIKATLAKVVKTAARAERMIDQFERAKEQQEQDAAEESGHRRQKRQTSQIRGKIHGKTPEQEHDQNREKDRGTDNR